MGEKKNDEFKKYLDKAGIIDQLTRLVVGLYEEDIRPQNPLELILFK
jgi:hypothetical protein